MEYILEQFDLSSYSLTLKFPLLFRSYTITCEQDLWNIQHGIPPYYAEDWGDEYNKKHWPEGHNFRFPSEKIPTAGPSYSSSSSSPSHKQVTFNVFKEVLFFDQDHEHEPEQNDTLYIEDEPRKRHPLSSITPFDFDNPDLFHIIAPKKTLPQNNKVFKEKMD